MTLDRGPRRAQRVPCEISGKLGTVFLFVRLFAGLSAFAAENIDSPNEADVDDGPAFAIGRFEIEYRNPHPDHPALEPIFPHRVQLERTPSGFVVPRSGGQTESVTLTGFPQAVESYHASALAVISRSLLGAVRDHGLLGVFVLPHPDDIDPNSEDDLRTKGNLALRYQVMTGRIKELRSLAIGQRITGDWLVNHKHHARIRQDSPLQPAVLANEEASDLLRKDVLEDYLHQLNRHPGRQVEAALATSQEGDGVALDYRVHEARPWTPYLQVADTGTERTSRWQSRLGIIHRQLTNRDDIFNLEYLNAGFDNLNGIAGSYEAPWFHAQRPRWMKTSGFEPWWIKWLDRDRIPWWGNNRLRWRVSGGWNRVEIDLGELEDFEVTEAITEDWNIGGQAIYQAYQRHNFFVDLYLGGRFRNVELDNQSLGNSGDVDLSSGLLGARMERVNEYSSILGHFGVEVGSAGGSDEDVINQGRSEADDNWVALHWNLGVSHYLEPLFDRAAWEDPSTSASSTLAHEVALSFRGQYAFDYRLIPQVSQVIGGLYSVRGFDQGTSVGDSVYVGSVEYRFHLPRALPVRRVPLQLPLIGDFRATPQQVYGQPDWDLVIRTFVDLGYSDRNGGEDVLEFDQFLMSAGIGLEATFLGKVRARVDWARGIAEHHSNDAGRNRIDDSGKFHFLFSIMY